MLAMTSACGNPDPELGPEPQEINPPPDPYEYDREPAPEYDPRDDYYYDG